jgi:integrase
VSTGLRQTELLGLRWGDIDLDLQSISVCRMLYKRRGVCEFKEPKTSHSKRCVSMTAKLADYLNEYEGERESLSLHLGRLLKPDDLVLSNVVDKPIVSGVLSHNFARIVKRAGLENVRFHDLRHTFASLMLLRGAKPKVISEALGHSSVAFTMDVYSHIIEGMQSDAMALLDEVLPSGKNGMFRKIRQFNGRRLTLSFGGPLAQLAEQLTLNQQVQGSIPWRLTFNPSIIC